MGQGVEIRAAKIPIRMASSANATVVVVSINFAGTSRVNRVFGAVNTQHDKLAISRNLS